MRTAISFLLLALSVTALASAQPNTIFTYAGGGPVNGPALSINVANPRGVAATPNGDVYFASTDWDAVYRLSGGVVTLIAGTPGAGGFSGDGGPATSASLSSPNGVAVDGSRNVYIADWGNNRIRKISADTGVITTVAGNGSSGYSGDYGPATSASLGQPYGVAVDGSGDIYIADTGNARIRKVSATTGVITTLAGNGSYGYSGDNGPATSAGLNNPFGVAVDGSGNLYIADTANNRVREVSATTGVITTVAGNGSRGYSGDNGPATSASLDGPSGVAVDGRGNVYIADSYNSRIRKVSAGTGVIATVAGGGLVYGGDGGPATSASLDGPSGVAVDFSGNIYIADTYINRIRKVSAETGVITTVAGNGTYGYSGDGGPAISASLAFPEGIAVDGSGNIYIADYLNNRIRKVSAETGVISTVAGDGRNEFAGDNVPAISASLYEPSGVAVDGSGNIYIADFDNSRIRKVSAETGVISTVAGNGRLGYGGDGGPATSASLYLPIDVAIDSNGNVYIADTYNNRIRKVSATTGVITTVAGNGRLGYGGDGGPATSASLAHPAGVAVDSSGNVYIADANNSRIRKVSVTTGVITTVAGNGSYGYSGDNGPATSASLYEPSGVAVDFSGNIYIADTYNHRLRNVSAATGVISTLAGNGSYGFSGDGGPATSSSLARPAGVAVDSSGNIYIADSGNTRIRKVEHPNSTTTLLTSNANPTTTQNLVLTATVSPSDATGSVEFFDGTTSLGTVALSAGTATLSGLLLRVGTHSLTAVYSSDANYAESTAAAISQVISPQVASTITLTSDGQPTQSDGQTVYVSILNSPATFTATIMPAAATGTVQFFDGPASLGVQTVSGGTAVLTTSSLTLGNHTITAVYSGDAFFTPRWAPALIQQVRDTASANNLNTGLSSRRR